MIKLTLAEVVKAIGGHPWGELPQASIAEVSTDSRTVKHDELFFALPGERFDGHNFVVDALARGATGAVIAGNRAADIAARLRGAQKPQATGIILEVPDPLVALGRLAAYHRRQFAGTVVAVVGSNGKTTTKAMIHHILSGSRQGRCSPKSFNNAVGVPLTLLSGKGGDEYLVVEIGTNHPGEIAALAEIARPDLVVLTCLAEEHLEGLGDLEGVAREECAVLRHLEPKGFAAVNIDNPIIRAHLPEGGLTLATFGHDKGADVRVGPVKYEAPWLLFKLNERFAFRLPVPGAHNAVNAAGAVTIARRFGFDYAEAAQRLESFTPPPMRNEIIELGGVTIVNDAYNANPGSALAAIAVLEQMPCRGRRIAVFGGMRELGSHAVELHQRVAQRLRESQVQRILLVGDAAEAMQAALDGQRLFGPQVDVCADVAACGARLATELAAGDVVLLKASRAVGLERVLEPLRARLAPALVTG